MLSYNEFKELAEELKTTAITIVHNEGMRRYKEGEFFFRYLGPLPGFKNSCLCRPTKERIPYGETHRYPKRPAYSTRSSSRQRHIIDFTMVKRNANSAASRKGCTYLISSSERTYANTTTSGKACSYLFSNSARTYANTTTSGKTHAYLIHSSART